MDTPTTAPEQVQAVSDAASWGLVAVWTVLGLLGAGIKVGAAIGKGEVLNIWRAGTTLFAGMLAGGTFTAFLISFLHTSQEAGYPIAVLVGVMAMGFFDNAIEGKIPLINKLMGGGNGQQ